MTERSGALDDQLLIQAFARLRAPALAVSLGVAVGLLLFGATAVLLVRAMLAPAPVAAIGPHLSLLGYYLPGYQVTWLGAGLGLLYGFVLGGVLGVAMALLLNLNHFLYLWNLRRKIRRSVILDAL
jgi:hypothetical protein